MSKEPGDPRRRPTPDALFDKGTLLALFAWGLIVLAFAVGGLADVTSLWWLVLFFGAVAPVALVAVRGWSLRKNNAGDVKRTERELLGALREYGELTPTAAAMLTSLTTDEAARVLETLTREGHLEARTRQDAISYALREGDRRTVSSTRAELSEKPLGDDGEGAALIPRSGESLIDPLSDRELAVLRLLAAGRTNNEISHKLFIAQGTVKAHVASIYRKLEVHSRAEAVSRAADLNLL